jgi:hypothetical protein
MTNAGEVGLAVDNHAALVIVGDGWRVVSAGGKVTAELSIGLAPTVWG